MQFDTSVQKSHNCALRTTQRSNSIIHAVFITQHFLSYVLHSAFHSQAERSEAKGTEPNLTQANLTVTQPDPAYFSAALTAAEK